MRDTQRDQSMTEDAARVHVLAYVCRFSIPAKRVSECNPSRSFDNLFELSGLPHMTNDASRGMRFGSVLIQRLYSYPPRSKHHRSEKH